MTSTEPGETGGRGGAAMADGQFVGAEDHQHSVQVGDGNYTGALARLRYLAARYGPPEIAALARPDELPQPPHRPAYRGPGPCRA